MKNCEKPTQRLASALSAFSASLPATIALVLALLGAVPMPLLVSTVQGEEVVDPGEIRADHPLWILDHATNEGVRVSDLDTSGLARLRAHGAGQFQTPRPAGYSPAQVRRAYGFDGLRKGNDGKGQTIAIIIGYDYPNAAADLRTFIETFKLKMMYGLPGRSPCTVADGPHPCFQVVYAQGTPPPFDELWGLESVLDIQWAHAMAPGADLLLVEGMDDTFVELFKAVDLAVNLGASVVSMSWGAPEGSAELLFDDHFYDPEGVTFVASSGDYGNGIYYPATSPYVVAVGGTKLPLDRRGNRTGPETAWSGSGGGISQFEFLPDYQSDYPIPATDGYRGVPDVSYNADPVTGFAVYYSYGYAGQAGWLVVAGTSAGAPQWAALIALANQRRNGDNLSSDNLLSSPLYDAAKQHGWYYHYGAYFDVKSGSNGTCGAVCTATRGYDFVTGLGSPNAGKLVAELADY